MVRRPPEQPDASYAHVEWSCSKCDTAGRIDLEFPAGDITALSERQRSEIEQQVQRDHEQSAMREKGRVCARTPNWALYAS